LTPARAGEVRSAGAARRVDGRAGTRPARNGRLAAL